MKIVRREKIITPENRLYANGFMTPTPFLLNEDTIRLFVGFWGEDFISRIGYFDLSAEDPARIVKISDVILDTNIGGTFDDNGLILGDVIRDDNKIRMYYVGFQQPKKAKFLAFSGLAESIDNGNSFLRVSNAPVMDRTTDGLYIRAIHTVLKEDGIYKIWYSTGNGWQIIDGKEYPRYDIWYTESADGVNIPDGRKIIACTGNEYRIGRPRVYKISDGYEMYATFDNLQKEYRVAYFVSKNGIEWERHDDRFLLKLSPSGWDSEMACYPCPLQTKYGKYFFYCGNGMGKEGFGFAKVEE